MIQYESESHLREEEERELQGAIIESHKQFSAGMFQRQSQNAQQLTTNLSATVLTTEQSLQFRDHSPYQILQ